MKSILFALIAGLAIPSLAAADPDPATQPSTQPSTPAIKGAYGFDVMKPQSSKCTKVSGSLLKKLTKSYGCTAPDDPTASASGKRMVATCQAKKGRSQYMLLGTKADCAEERETQLANGD
jgi:hypothetical protein